MLIEYLRGTVIKIDEDHVLLDVNGVGYGLDVPAPTLEALPEVGTEAVLHVSMVIREDAMLLFGFGTSEQRAVFEVLRETSGIGPRTALDVLSVVPLRDLIQSVQVGNVNVLTSVPGIGPKRAQRLLVELKDRMKALTPYLAKMPAQAAHADVAAAQDAPQGPPDLYQDAVAALQALGLKPAMASRQVAAALRLIDDENPTVEEVVRVALKAGK